MKETQDEIERLRTENTRLQRRVEDQKQAVSIEKSEDEHLKDILGPKFDEYGIMVDQVKKNLRRVASMVEQAYYLDTHL
jgi:predicted nuclease with TOPRIM domain